MERTKSEDEAVVFDFDIRKTIAAVAFLTEKEGGELDMFLSLKMLYLADKEALVRWGKTITGDKFVSLPKGPVLSRIYNLFKGEDRSAHQAEWDSVFGERVNHSIRLLKEVDTGLLSEREMEVLESARCQIHEVAPWEVSTWLHETCPEWSDPHGSSIPIDPATILRNAGMTEEEIAALIRENEAQRYAASTLLGH